MQAANAQKNITSRCLLGEGFFKEQGEGEACGVYGRIMDIILITWQWGNQESI